MSQPLTLSYPWRPHVLFSSIGATICVGALAHSRAPGWVAVLVVVVVLWALVVTLIWARTRAYLQVAGSRLTVRRTRRLHTIEGEQLVRVRQFLTASGPCYSLVVRDGEGRERSHVAPVALLREGHSTLFRWILAQAPRAELDRGSVRTLDQLRVRGLVE